MWNHVLAVELIRKKFNISDESNRKNFFDNILPNVSRKSIAREKAVKYLEEWGDKFWTETEYRVKEFTSKLEDDIRASLGAKYKDVGFGIEAARNLSSEQKGEIIKRANEVVEKGQIAELLHVISLLADDIFTDPQQRYFVIIDRLDEGWVEDSIRYKLIKALIEAIRNFQKIRSVKVIAAIRTDLLQRVLRRTVSPGFQDEKYEALYLKLRWSENELEAVLDKRINEVFKSKYTKGEIHFRDVFPKNQMEKTDAFGYILKRTSLRPREVIMFINDCIERSEGKTKITADIIRSAEVTYSQKRVVSLEQEWGSDYPNISSYIRVIKGKGSHFCYSNVEDAEIISSVGDCLQQTEIFEDPLTSLGQKYVRDAATGEEIKREWFSIMYRIGVLGMKPAPTIQVQWSFVDEAEMLDSQDLTGVEFYVHPAYWIGLGVSLK